jgi:hypothetical protein
MSTTTAQRVTSTAVAATTLTYCSPGATTICDAVLVVCASAAFCTDAQTRLRGTGAFATVDTFDASSGTPTAAQLAAYHAVVAFSHSGGFSDPALLGDRLAAYHDQGGGVVIAPFANANAPGYGNTLKGAYGTPSNGYALLDYANGSYSYPADTLGDVMEPQSPLMVGVTSLSALHAYRSTSSVISGRGVVVARWRGGGQEPLVVRGTRGNRTLVELNFFPGSIDAYVSSGWTGDGALLMRNALKYSRCMANGSGTSSTAGALGKGRARAEGCREVCGTPYYE